jgi:hypothetical protein
MIEKVHQRKATQNMKKYLNMKTIVIAASLVVLAL